MIRMFQCQTADHAKNYFKTSLSKADYYIQDQELEGHFNGRLAKRLGLEGQIADTETFNKLCDNINPKDGGSLTPRTVSNRRVGYDISFHAPKSVSLLYGLTGDEKILKTFQRCVHETMLEIEADMQTRVRTQGQYDDRSAPELIWADFTHLTARPTKDHVADAHLHTHVFTWNCVYDDVEDRIKAGQFHNIKRDMPYYQARFQKMLADGYSEMGYGIRKTKNGFDLSVIPQEAIDLFSKRTNHIGQIAKEEGITDPKALDELGARTRVKKQPHLSMADLKDDWVRQLDEAGIDERTREEKVSTDLRHTAEKSVDHAIDHSFSRASVKRERQILTEGYKYAVDNQNVSLDDIDKTLQKDKRVFQIEVGSQTLCTTALVLKEERTMVQLARNGMGKFRPFQPAFELNGEAKKLGLEQKIALRHIMASQDQLTMIRGGAGTGKTTLIKHAVSQIQETGKNVFLLAPTSTAAHDVLKSEGFEKAETLARFLLDEKLQEQTEGQVIWVDEAGMLGTKDMATLLEIADKNNARVILSGDPRQHSAVDRGDAMRILKTVGHIPQASLETIYRQKEDNYKQAVSHISKGNIETGFKKLESMGVIQENDYSDIAKTLSNDYLKSVAGKKSALVISPTRDQTRIVNQQIREGLKARRKIGKRERLVTILDNRNLTIAQKQDPRSYEKGNIIQAGQNMKGIKRSDQLTVKDVKGGQVIIEDKRGKHHILPLNRAKDYDVYVPRQIPLSKGDEIRINKPRYDKENKRLNNGTVLKIKKFSKKEGITAVKKSKNKETEFKLSEDFGNFDYAYCTTSYGSQGKTVDHVFINQPSVTFAASNQKQFYVSTSRAREGVTIYTDDKESLLTQVQRSGDRLGATELEQEGDLMPKAIDIDTVKTKEIIKTNDKGYEPEL